MAKFDNPVAYHADETPPKPVANINLFRPETPVKAKPAPPPAKPSQPSSGRRRLLVSAGLVVLVTAAAGSHFLWPSVQPPIASNSPALEPTSTPVSTGVPRRLPVATGTAGPAQPIPVPETPLAQAPATGARYVVVRSDTLISIGERLQKDWRAIYEANRNAISDPSLIYAGTVLVIP